MAEMSKKGTNGGKKEGSGGGPTVLKVKNCPCWGCASICVKCIRGFEGVTKVEVDDNFRLMVTGKFDPVKLQAEVERKTGKKVELVTPVPKKKPPVKQEVLQMDLRRERVKEVKDSKGRVARERVVEAAWVKGPTDDVKDLADRFQKAQIRDVATGPPRKKEMLQVDGPCKTLREFDSKGRLAREWAVQGPRVKGSITDVMALLAAGNVATVPQIRDVATVPPRKDKKKGKVNGGHG